MKPRIDLHVVPAHLLRAPLLVLALHRLHIGGARSRHSDDVRLHRIVVPVDASQLRIQLALRESLPSGLFIDPRVLIEYQSPAAVL